jgi:hypothetical protein
MTEMFPQDKTFAFNPQKTMTTSTETHRVPVINLEMNVSYGCNLQCEYCTHLGRFMKGVVTLDELLFWYRSWNTKIRPSNVRIMGGEPLLHPELEKIIYETKEHWKDSNVELITNGLLLPQMSPCIFAAMKATEATVAISRHFDDPFYNSAFETGINSLRNHGMEPRISHSTGHWVKCYRIDEQGHRSPYKSDPEKAWNNCGVKNLCTTLLDNYLYRCPQLGCYSYAVKKGFVSFDDWKVALDYKPLPHSCTSEELEAFMNGGACEQCSICPEEFQCANMYEKINLFGLPLTRNRFFGDNNHE